MASHRSPVVEETLRALTMEEKVSLLAGKNMWETTNIDRLGIPSLKMTDGPAGARGLKWTYGSLTTFIPCGISLAATFDPVLVEKVGAVLGQETQRKRCHVLLAPTMNLSRSPLGGRNFEGYGEDPYLVGAMSIAMIQGIQSQGAAACMKHFIANDTETRRFNVDQMIDERTLREVYMKPFVMALEASPLTAMVSYPKINGCHADLSPFILKTLLREELGYDRLVMSDWGGLNSTIESLLATTDLEMPGPAVRRGDKLLAAISEGRVDVANHVDPSVRRILELLDQVGLLLPSSSKDILQSEETGAEQALDDPSFHEITREAAQSGLVLLKNDDILPLRLSTLKQVALVGPNARKPTAGGSGSAAVNPFYITTPEECITKGILAANPEIEVAYEPGMPFSLRPPLLGAMLKTPDGTRQGLQVTFYAGYHFEGPPVATSYWDDSLVYLMSDGDAPPSLKGTPYCYRASGIVTPKESGRYTWSLANTGKAKLFIDNELVVDNTEWTKVTASFLGCSSEDRVAHMVLEAGRSYQLTVENQVALPPFEAFDNTLFPNISGLRVGLAQEQDEQELMNRAVARAQSADITIMVVGHNKDSEGEGGDRANMQLPGQTDALVHAVCAANPNTIVVVQSASAVSMPWANEARAIVMGWYQGQENGNALADALLGHCNFSGKTPITMPHRLEDHGSHPWFPGQAANDYCEFGEGILVGYRHFDKHGIQPLWPFGYGLSYTRFELSDIRIEGQMTISTPSTITIRARVANTGEVDGSEVVQVYVSPSKHIEEMGLVSYVKTLAGFAKVFVPAGEKRDVAIEVGNQELRRIDSRLVSLYYLHFHQAHPFLPPREVLLQSSPPNYLLDVMQHISTQYLAADHIHDHTTQLRVAVQDADLCLEKVQALLLLSLILHARTEAREARECLAQAIASSLELGLHRREFSDALDIQNPIRAESARRTWWEIFVTDTFLAAVQVGGALQLTVETPYLPLPCEEDEYHDGRFAIVSTSLRDMDWQALFHNEGDFSSSAYRVEAAVILRRCLLASQNHVAQALNVGVLKSMGDTWKIAAVSMARIRDVAMEIEMALFREPQGLLDDVLVQPASVDSQDFEFPVL
ncbi:hypothetical protein BBP40_005613 [Aspergillus hancockii]|nr:hypothetical protein BBP40_005613 [Aspergillus hancockii]